MNNENPTAHMLPGKSKGEIAASRLPFPDRATLSTEEIEAFDYALARSERFFESIPSEYGAESRLTPLFQGIVQSPNVAEPWAHFGDYCQTSEERDSFNSRERDVALLSLVPTLVCSRTGKFPLSPIWVTWAVAAGITAPTIVAIVEEKLDGLRPEDRQIFEFVRATASGGLRGEDFDALVKRWNTKTAIEFISFVTWRIAILRTVQAHWGIQDLLTDNTAGFTVLQEYLNGERAPETYDMSTRVRMSVIRQAPIRPPPSLTSWSLSIFRFRVSPRSLPITRGLLGSRSPSTTGPTPSWRSSGSSSCPQSSAIPSLTVDRKGWFAFATRTARTLRSSVPGPGSTRAPLSRQTDRRRSCRWQLPSAPSVMSPDPHGSTHGPTHSDTRSRRNSSSGSLWDARRIDRSDAARRLRR